MDTWICLHGGLDLSARRNLAQEALQQPESLDAPTPDHGTNDAERWAPLGRTFRRSSRGAMGGTDRAATPGLPATQSPNFEGIQQSIAHLRRDVRLAEIPHGADRGPHLLDVCPATIAYGQVVLEPAVVIGRQGVLEVLGDKLDEFPAGEPQAGSRHLELLIEVLLQGAPHA